MRRPRLACTVVSKCYLACARVLARSVLEHEPGVRVVVLLLDRVEGAFDPAAEPFETVLAETLDNIPERERFFFQYSVLELATAIKPYFLDWLLEREGPCELVFLDPDIMVLQPFAPLWSELQNHPIALTPHVLQAIEDDRRPGELEILQAGLYNLGFLALRAGATARSFLAWWKARLLHGCLLEPARGMHVDQKWVDLAPLFFPETAVLRDPGWNVAYWNLAERPLSERDGVLHAAGSPLRFFHFSGFDAERCEGVSRHQDRFALGDLPVALRGLFEHYRRRLLEEGHAGARRLGYAFDRFADGTPIPAAARRLYHELGARAREFGDPFTGSGAGSFRHWLIEALPPGGCSRLALALHALRADLQSSFPQPNAADAPAFLDWLAHSAVRDFGLASALLPLPLPRPAPSAPAAAPPRSLGALARLGRAARRFSARSRLEPVPPPPFGVNLAGYAESEKGVGEALRGQLRALRQLGVPLALCNFADPHSANREAPAHPFSSRAPYAVHLLQVNADQLPSFAQHVGADWFAGRHTIGAWYWELSSFPQRWLDHVGPLSEVWAASHFVQDALARALPVPVVRVPPALELDPVLGEFSRAALGLREDDFVFLFAFDLASYTQRKNPLGLIEAFRRAFAPGERAALLLKLTHPEADPAGARQLRDAAAEAGVQLLESVLPRADMLALLAGCDAYVSLHRSEGFGLTLAEAMALGRPVIATGYSGNTDFMNAANSLLVDYRLVELAEDVGPYVKGARWAEPDLEHAAHCMRSLFRDRARAAELGARGRRDVRAQLSPAAVGELVAQRLEAIRRLRGWR